jgi:hypothetical protein
MNPRFPIYIPSKGRHESRLTMKALEKLHVPYRVIVEEPEFSAYAKVIDKRRLLVLDPKYQRDYDAMVALKDGESRGSGPARNFAWDHAISAGADWHWVIDDNIRGFWRFNHNLKIPVADGTIIRCMEDFCLRYENVAMAGPDYYMFTPRKAKHTRPFTLNTRIYSCNLIRCDLPFRWRGRYNEDADLSIRLLKAGYCTILFNAFMQWKMTATPGVRMKGGNTEEVYKGGSHLGALEKSKLLVASHPDVARMVWRFNRWHHHVDYSAFAGNKLRRRVKLKVKTGVDNYGMRLEKNPEWKGTTFRTRRWAASSRRRGQLPKERLGGRDVAWIVPPSVDAGGVRCPGPGRVDRRQGLGPGEHRPVEVEGVSDLRTQQDHAPAGTHGQ